MMPSTFDSQTLLSSHPLSKHSSVFDFTDDFKSNSNSSGWIKYELKQKRSNYTQPHPIRLWIGSWNTAGKPPKTSFKEWLPSSIHQVDVLVFGFQEIDMSTDSFIISDSKLMDTLHQHISTNFEEPLECLAKAQLIGLFILVFAKPEFSTHIKNVETGIVGCGLMGLLGNKGAVSVRFQAFDSKLCFVNSHLASGLHQQDRRNSDFQEIKRRLQFKKLGGTEYRPFNEQDFTIFWFGDLNYRIKGAQQEVVDILKTVDGLSRLREKDQLLEIMKNGTAFQGYNEAEITFEPTYKYDIGTHNFDTSEKKRAPAWCDRILWYTSIDSKQVSNQQYQCHKEYVDSDHKPVSALFEVQLDIIDPEKYESVVRQLLRTRDQFENVWVPEITLSENQLSFGQVKLSDLATHSITLTNNGKLPVNWLFAPKLDSDTISKPWTWADPISGYILPGESTQVCIYLKVNFDSAASLNQLDDPHFSEVYILRLVNGRDYFISVEAVWTPTQFARSLTELCKDCSVPHLLLQLTNALLQHNLGKSVFYTLPSESELLQAIETLEAPHPEHLADIPPTCLARLLICFLQYCPVPVIPEAYHVTFSTAKDTQFMELVSDLPPAHRSVLLYLLQFALQYAGTHPRDHKWISDVLGPLVLREAKLSKSKEHPFLNWMYIFMNGI